ncbi:psmB1 [Symbiodinium sp. CCMP2592]|nr:psmB1 [Symbiodinium sp. CCMP2592]
MPDIHLFWTGQAPTEHRWSPYADNGGTCMGVAGEDFVVVAADTRLSQGYSIHTRDCSKVTQLTDKCVIASCGMKADAITLHKHLKARMVMYEHQHRKQPSVTAIAQMLATTLYYKRFFPYYTFNVLCGIDDEGKGAVYHYDAIGSFERVPYTTSGSGSSLVMSVLDAQIAKGNQTIDTPALDKRGIVELCKDVLSSVGERDIHTGDYGEIFLIDAAGVSPTRFDLKLD